MNEVFTNALEFQLTVDDNGITFKDGQNVTEFPYGSIEEKLKVGMLGNVYIIGHGFNKTFVAFGKDKSRLKEAIAFAEKMNRQATPCTPKEYAAAPVEEREYRKRCNVCGQIFCYTDKDLARNQELLNEAVKARKMAVLEALGGTRLASNQNTDRADNIESKVVDYSKCPKCNSTDLVEISADEFKELKERQNNGGSSTVSAADELKKFKELLDAGVITQEEFDAKKKQLLGL